MEYQELLKVALNFATAILLGALIGIEREKRKERSKSWAASPACAPSPCSPCSARPPAFSRKSRPRPGSWLLRFLSSAPS